METISKPSLLRFKVLRLIDLQLLKSVGVLNLPEWYDAGVEAQKNSFAPFSMSLLSIFY